MLPIFGSGGYSFPKGALSIRNIKMDREQLMQMAAEKAVNEVEWESIEFLFRPSNQLELWLRLDFEGMKKKIAQWWADDSPGAMPFRFRRKEGAPLSRAVRVEEFYRRLKAIHESRSPVQQKETRLDSEGRRLYAGEDAE
jgi:hypothetical protein